MHFAGSAPLLVTTVSSAINETILTPSCRHVWIARACSLRDARLVPKSPARQPGALRRNIALRLERNRGSKEQSRSRLLSRELSIIKDQYEPGSIPAARQSHLSSARLETAEYHRRASTTKRRLHERTVPRCRPAHSRHCLSYSTGAVFICRHAVAGPWVLTCMRSSAFVSHLSLVIIAFSFGGPAYIGCDFGLRLG